MNDQEMDREVEKFKQGKILFRYHKMRVDLVSKIRDFLSSINHNGSEICFFFPETDAAKIIKDIVPKFDNLTSKLISNFDLNHKLETLNNFFENEFPQIKEQLLELKAALASIFVEFNLNLKQKFLDVIDDNEQNKSKINQNEANMLRKHVCNFVNEQLQENDKKYQFNFNAFTRIWSSPNEIDQDITDLIDKYSAVYNLNATINGLNSCDFSKQVGESNKQEKIYIKETIRKELEAKKNEEKKLVESTKYFQEIMKTKNDMIANLRGELATMRNNQTKLNSRIEELEEQNRILNERIKELENQDRILNENNEESENQNSNVQQVDPLEKEHD